MVAAAGTLNKTIVVQTHLQVRTLWTGACVLAWTHTQSLRNMKRVPDRVCRPRPPAGVDLEDVFPRLRIRQRKADLPIKTARAPQGRVD